MPKKNIKMRNIVLIASVLVVAALVATFVVAINMGNHGCCVSPPCKECYKEWGFCVCDFREEMGFRSCDECLARGCGSYTSNGTEICHVQ